MAPLRVTKWEQYLQEPHLHHCHLLAIASLVAVQQVCISLAWQHGNPGLGGCGTQATVFIGGGEGGRGGQPVWTQRLVWLTHVLILFPIWLPKGPVMELKASE